MLILRAVAVLTLLFLVGLGGAWVVTRDRRYLRIAAKTVQTVLLLAVAFALFYLFERVLLFL
jgi:hypothetical protein